jgi:outer membrane receptor protein involved in Fe transport
LYRTVLIYIFFIVFFLSPLRADGLFDFDYVSIGISSQKIDNKSFNKGSALVINTGKKTLYKDVGVELEGTLQLKKPKAVINNKTSDLKFWSMGMYGTYLWKFDSITVKPKLGLVYENIKSSFNTSNNNPTDSVDKNKIILSGGIGLSYKLTDNYQLFTNYTKFDDDIEHLTFGAEFKF